jgi:hypothetical protein
MKNRMVSPESALPPGAFPINLSAHDPAGFV